MSKFRLHGQHKSKLAIFALFKIGQLPATSVTTGHLPTITVITPIQQDIAGLESRMLSILASELRAVYTDNVLQVLGDFDLLTTTRYVSVHFKPTIEVPVNVNAIVNIRSKEEVKVATHCRSALELGTDSDLFKAYNEFNSAKNTKTQELEAELADYINLIAASEYLEDVVAVWGEVSEISSELKKLRIVDDSNRSRNGDVSVSSVARIKAGVELRLAKEYEK